MRHTRLPRRKRPRRILLALLHLRHWPQSSRRGLHGQFQRVEVYFDILQALGEPREIGLAQVRRRVGLVGELQDLRRCVHLRAQLVQ
jgi:hypothetical protein